MRLRHQLLSTASTNEEFCTKQGGCEAGQFNGVIEIYPKLTLAVMVTKI